MLGSVAGCKFNRYELVRGLWKSVAVPSNKYELETTVWSKKELDKLKVWQNKAGWIALGASRCVAVETDRGDMGWSSF